MRIGLRLSAACAFLAMTAVSLSANAMDKPAPNPALQKCVRDNGAQDQDAAISDCTVAIVSGKLSRNDMFTAYAFRSIAYFAKKNFDATLADGTALVHIAPNNGVGFVARAKAYEGLDKPEQAIAEYTKAIAVDKKTPGAYLNRGVLYANAGKYPEAEKDFETCLKLDPKQQNCRSSLDAVNNIVAQSHSPAQPASAGPRSAGSDWSGPAYYLVMNFSSGLKPFIYDGPYSSQADCEAANAKYSRDGNDCEYLATDPDKSGN